MTEKDSLSWEKISEEHVVSDRWIDFRRSAYRFPDGRIFEPFYSFTKRDYAVIAASDTDGNYICVRQFRQGIERVTTEFPAGGIENAASTDDGSAREAAFDAAKRELLEETGYVSDEWKHLLSIPSKPTICDNYVHIFSAKNCRKISFRMRQNNTDSYSTKS